MAQLSMPCDWSIVGQAKWQVWLRLRLACPGGYGWELTLKNCQSDLRQAARAASLGAMLILLPVLAAGLAPERPFHHYVKDAWSIEEGLPQITVNSIVQGPEGYIWVATQAGLARFDGVRFTNFTPSDTPALQGIFLRTLFVDRSGRMWIGSYRGASVHERGSFQAVHGRDDLEYDVFGFAETSDARILVATDRGLLEVVDDVLVSRPGYPGEPSWSVFHHDGTTLVGGRGVIFSNDGARWQQTRLQGEQAVAQVTEFLWHDGTFWAATSRGLLFFDRGEWRRFEIPGLPSDLVIEALHVDRDDNFWIGAAGRLIRLQGRALVEVVPDDAAHAHPGVLSMAEDHEGNLWLGGRWSGLARLWNGWVTLYDRPEGLHNSLVWSVARDSDGNLWTGTMDGLAVLADGRFEQVTQGRDQPHPHAYTLLPEDDRVWVGTRSGVFLWNRIEQRIDRPDEFSVLNGSQVNGIVQYRDAYWLATFDGVWRWDGREMRRMAERNQPGGQDVRMLFETSSGELLAGTRTGMLKLAGDSFEPVTEVAVGQDVISMLELDDGTLVAGSIDERLWFRIDGHWHEFSAADGLPPNSAYALAEHDGVLWVAGLRGIHELALSSVHEYLAGRIDSLPARVVLNERGDVPGAQKGYCCNGAGNAKGFMADGQFWLPTRNGVLKLVPEHIVRNPEPPAVRINRIRFGGQWHELADEHLPELGSEHRDLAFGFSALSFQHPMSVQVEYRLVGFEERWQQLDMPMQRQVIYTNLPAGSLRLEVRATNNAGVWSPEPGMLSLHIPPRLWETTAFRVLLLFAAVIGVWLVYNLRLRKLQSRRMELEHMVAERTEELRIANEHLQDYSSRMENVTMTDPLTGLWNRRYLHSQLPLDLAHFQRELVGENGDEHLMLFALIDIDQFRHFNECHGHAAGDAVLRQLADRLRKNVRKGDYVTRWAGEQFLMVFRPMRPAEFTKVAQRLIATMHEKTFDIDANEAVGLTFSAGLSQYPAFRDHPTALSWEDTVVLSSKALAYAKQQQRGGWCLISPTSWTEPATLMRRIDESIDQLVLDKQVTIRQGGTDST